MSNLYSTEYKVAGDFDLYLMAKKANLFTYPPTEFLTEIESEGYASRNPILAYQEYLKIAYRRLKGVSRLLSLVIIFSWAVIIIISKKVFPERFFCRLKLFIKISAANFRALLK